VPEALAFAGSTPGRRKLARVTVDSPPSETAYYYPEPFWRPGEAAWIKSLLLFFDDVAILLPEYMRGRHAMADPSLVEPLEDRRLLRVLEPETFVDEELTKQLTDVVLALVQEGAFDSAPPAEGFAELSMSRMGYGAIEEMAHGVYLELRKRGLATETADGVSIPMHPRVRNTYLVLIAQLAREAGARHGLDLHPATNNPGATTSFQSFLALEPMPSRGHVVSFDLDVVTVDLEPVPLDEVLEFREEHKDAHRQYMQNLRSFTLDLSLLNDADRRRALADRRADLEAAARDLRARARRTWKSPRDVAGFGLGITGAAWALAAQNPVPAALGAIGAALRMLPAKAQGNAYSYLFAARRSFP
jgi:hypothetical protein